MVKDARLSSLEEWQKFVIITFDEMKIREGLVYDKYNDQLIGFVSLDDITNRLLELERTCTSTSSPPTIATHMLVLLVRGLTIPLKFPFAQFPTNGVAAYQLYPLISEAILRLEMLGFKVICLTSNGASPNRKLCRILQSNRTSTDTVPYRMENVYTDDDRNIYFMSDVPHLLKTTRNCWANSSAHNRSRHLWVSRILLKAAMKIFYTLFWFLQINGMEISWQHLVRVYEANTGQHTDTPGLVLLPKVKYEHIHLTSYSKMRVDLAAQVCFPIETVHILSRLNFTIILHIGSQQQCG